MRQDGRIEFISASLNTDALLKRASLGRKKCAGGETHTLLTCFTKVRLGAAHALFRNSLLEGGAALLRVGRKGILLPPVE